MVKKSKGGKSHRKGKKPQQDDRNSMVFREEGEEYAKVVKMLGSGRMEVQLPDNTTKLAIIRGKLRRRRTWINTGDVVLVAIRDFQEDRCDVLFTYSPNQLQILKKRKQLPEHFGSNRVEGSESTNQAALDVDFCDSSDEDEGTVENNVGEQQPIQTQPPMEKISEENESSASSGSEENDDFVFDDI